MVLALLASVQASGEEAPASARALLEQARAAGAVDRASLGERLRPASTPRIAQLRLLLSDADPALRRLAATGLSSLGDYPLQGLVRLLDDEDREVRQAAEEALVAAGAPAVEAMGGVLAGGSCVAESFRAAVRILGRSGDPAAIPFLAGALVQYRKGGFPQSAAMGALKQIGGAPAVSQLLQLTAYRELGEEAFLTLLSMDRDGLTGTIVSLLADGGADAELRFFYALQLNEILGSEAAAPALLEFYGRAADDPALPPEARKKALMFRNLFAKIRDGDQLHREPLTQKRLNAMYALRKEDEESPYVESRREQERKMDEIRAAREAERRPAFLRLPANVHFFPR